MRIAISADDSRGLDSVAAHHFGRCPYYVFVDLEGQQLQRVVALANPHYANHQPGAVPAFIREQGANVMIAGGMGQRAIALFERYGIEAYTSAMGTVRHVLEQYAGGALEDARPCRDHNGADHAHEAHDDAGHTEEAGATQRMREEVAALQDQIATVTERLTRMLEA